MRVEEVARELGISKSHAYKVIHKLNAELREKGYLTIAGRVNRNLSSFILFSICENYFTLSTPKICLTFIFVSWYNSIPEIAA